MVLRAFFAKMVECFERVSRILGVSIRFLKMCFPVFPPSTSDGECLCAAYCVAHNSALPRRMVVLGNVFKMCACGFRVVRSVGRFALRKAMGICASRLFPAQPPVSEYDTKSGKNRQKRHLSILRPFRQIWKTGENVLSLCSEKRGYAPRAYPLFRAIDYQ